MKLSALFSFATAGVLGLLAGCGGAGNGPGVQNVTASNARYSANMLITVNGRALDQGIEVVVDGPCSGLARSGTVTDATAQYTCTVNGIGRITPHVRVAGGGVELASLKVDIPLPHLSVSVTDGTRTGSFVLEIDPVAAPVSAAQFFAYHAAGFYTNTLFHRVRPDTAILGGGFVVDSASGAITAKAATRSPIELERTGLKNLRGAVAMYREAGLNTANSIFFINTVDNPRFDAGSSETPDGYAVFGKVVDGLAVIDEIAKVPVRPDLVLGVGDVPITPVRITAIFQIR